MTTPQISFYLFCVLVVSLHCFANPSVFPFEFVVLEQFGVFGVVVVLLLKHYFDPCGWICLLSSSGTNRLESQPPRHGFVRVDHSRIVSTDSLFRDLYDDSEDEDDEVGYADPIQDDVYARKVGVKPQSPSKVSYDKYLPKFWTPEEDVHIQKIKLGSQRRPWYRKMQGFRCVRT